MIPIRQIHQIEITSRCNLRCRYCVHPKMPRPKVDMDVRTFVRALEVTYNFQQLKSQGSLNLAGIGESTIHPQFVEFVTLARELLGPNQDLVLATNGVAVTKEMTDALVPLRVRVFVSLHRPERAKLAIDLLSDRGLLAGVSADPSLAATDWAGQVEWKVTAPKGQICPWLKGGMAFVMADGNVTRCAFDGKGTGIIGTIHDDHWTTAPYALCRDCNQDPGYPLEKVA